MVGELVSWEETEKQRVSQGFRYGMKRVQDLPAAGRDKMARQVGHHLRKDTVVEGRPLAVLQVLACLGA